MIKFYTIDTLADMYAMCLTRLYMHVVPNLSLSSIILDIIGMLLTLSTPSLNTTSSNRFNHEYMNVMQSHQQYTSFNDSEIQRL